MTWSSSSTNKSGGQYLELLCSELQEGTAVIDQSTGMVVFCNPAWLSMFGLSGSGDLHIAGLGKVRKYPLPAANWAGYLATAGNRATRYEDVEFIRRNGRSFHATCLIRTMKRNNQQMYMVVLNQTGTFTPTGWQTSQEKACLTAVLEHTDTGIIEVNQLTQIVGINTAALRLFGYTKQELMGRKIQALIPERLRYQYTGSSAATNLCGLKKSGEEFPVEISLTNYTFDHQPFIIVFVTDISARKKKTNSG